MLLFYIRYKQNQSQTNLQKKLDYFVLMDLSNGGYFQGKRLTTDIIKVTYVI